MDNQAVTIVKIRPEDLERLNKLKIHPRQGAWEVIKTILDKYEKEVNSRDQ